MGAEEQYFSYLKTRSYKSLLYRYFFSYRRIRKHISGKALDIGCGIGDFLKLRANTVGIDINYDNVQYCKKRGFTALHAATLPYPFENHAFDSAVLDNVLEHIEDPVQLLDEIHRLLKPHGRLVIGIPGVKGYLHDRDHKHYYDEDKLVEQLYCSGFSLYKFFYVPFKSSVLSLKLRQYCIYGIFIRQPS